MAVLTSNLAKKRWSSRVIDYGSRAEFTLPFIILGLGIYLSITASSFLTGDNFQNLARQGSVLAILAFGQTIVVLAGGLDLSTASTMAVVSVVTAKLAAATGSPVPLLVGPLIGLGVGLFNGTLVAVFQMSAIVVTLGMLVFLRGIANVIAEARPIFDVPEAYDWLGTTRIGPVPVMFLIALGFFVIVYALLKRSTFGLHVYAIGDNPTAAKLSGVNTTRVLFLTYVLSGLLAGVAGALLTSRVGSGQARLAEGFEIPTLTAVFLGGVALTGGVGSLLGVLFGVVLLTVLANGLNLLGVVSFVQQIISGGILLASIALTQLFTYRKSRTGQPKRARALLEVLGFLPRQGEGEKRV